MEIRLKYFELFDSSQGKDVRMYNALHKEGTGIADNSDESWLIEAQGRGKIFPERPRARLRLDFGASPKSEIARSCRKTAKSHRRIQQLYSL